MQDAVEGAGYTVVLKNNDWNALREEKPTSDGLRQKQFDGLIINPTGTLNSALIDLNFPVVGWASGESVPDFVTVSSSSAQARRIAMEHLRSLGHRRIRTDRGAAAAAQIAQLTATPTSRRCTIHGLDFDPALLSEATSLRAGSYAAMQTLLTRPDRPTAVFAVNDIMALGGCAPRRMPACGYPTTFRSSVWTTSSARRRISRR